MDVAALDINEQTKAYLPGNIPSQIGPYCLERKLGEGGMGMVFVATHTLMNRRVAIKIIRPLLKDNEGLVRRFRHEITALGKVPDHANLVRAQYAGEEAGLLYLVMDYVEGINLNEMLVGMGPMPVPVACGLIWQAAQGLQAIHGAGMVHRDLKPSNLMMTEEGVVKILDLGLARLAEGEEFDELTPANCHLGTLDYQAPEQASDARRVDIRADIYSLGCTLYKLLTGRAPFADCVTPAAKIHRRAEGRFPTLTDDTHRDVVPVLARMVALRPNDRFVTPAELVAALAPLMGSIDLSGSCQEAKSALIAKSSSGGAATVSRASHETEPATIPGRPQHKSKFGHALLVVGVVLALIGAGAGFFIRSWGRPKVPIETIAALPLPLWAKSQPEDSDKPRPITESKSLPQLDQLPELQWHELLDHEPTEVVMNKADGAALARFDPKTRQFLVTSPLSAMFLFGELARPSYTYQVSLMQIGWSSGAGIVFGYRPDDPKSGKTWPGKCQYIAMNTQKNVKGDLAYYISRGSARIHELAENIHVTLTTHAMEEVPTPRGEQIIEIVVDRCYLREIRVNGVPVPALCSVDTNGFYTPGQYLGGLGTLTIGTSCTYRKANLKIHPALN